MSRPWTVLLCFLLPMCFMNQFLPCLISYSLHLCFFFPIILCLKAPVCSVCVCRVYCWCTCVFLLFPALDVLCWILKIHSCYPRLHVPSGSVTWQKTRPNPLPLCVPSVFPRFLFSVFCFGCSLMDPLLRPENFLLLPRQGRDRSRATPDCS